MGKQKTYIVLANYKAISPDKFGKEFLGFCIGSLSECFNYRKGYIFTRSMISGLEKDSLYSSVYQSVVDSFLKDYSDSALSRERIVTMLSNKVIDSSSMVVMQDFILYAVCFLSHRYGNIKQYVISRCLVSGLAGDSEFGRFFSQLKSNYAKSDGSSFVVESKKFIYDILGNY